MRNSPGPKKKNGAQKTPTKKWAHRVSCPFLSLILCTLQLSPLYHCEKGIEEGSPNMYFVWCRYTLR
jgi:hypothetical protein